MIKIISWNVNGLRALHRKELLLPFIKKQKPDILCLQETKANEEQLSEEIRIVEKYHSFFSSSQKKKGYGGVAIYTKEQPQKIEYGMGIKKFDEEGRVLVAYFKDFVLFNIYVPNAGNMTRLPYKMEFYKEFLKYIKKQKKPVIFCGDINTAHNEIDLARPKNNENHTGFLPIERAWFDKVIKTGYVDVFRNFYPKKTDAYTYWDIKTCARERNVGWRLDYFFVSKLFINNVKSTKILSDVFGSDHCPIELNLK
ncbi:exodeoxyribonuclease III [Patescibacteria group bacterium]